MFDLRELFNEASLAALADAEPAGEPPMHVTRFDTPWRFLVRSQDPRKPEAHYLVDLEQPGFPRGWCDCDDFGMRKEGKIRREERVIKTTCKHIDRVRGELQHARSLCEIAGMEFSPLIIPTLAEYERRAA